MGLQFGLTSELTNTQFAPVAALIAHYQTENVLEPLQSVAADEDNKLIQVIVSILTGCEYISMVNTRLRPERTLAQVNRIAGFVDQSTLARHLDQLTQMNLDALAQAVGQICQRCSRTQRHDWRGFLLIDFDLSALPCGKAAMGSTKGYFSGKKTAMVANWPGPVPSNIRKPYGQTCSQATH